MGELSRLFWQAYPKMYRRFGDLTGAPRDIILAIEDEGYEVAEAGGDRVHLHDQWLWNDPEDYDCITHELGHIIQNGWNGDFLEYDSMIELFVDCLRYEYALDGGYYNDAVWTLHTPDGEDDRSSSVRFLVWLDYFWSTEEKDIMRRFCEIAHGDWYMANSWDLAWEDLFQGTGLEGKTIDEVWEEYVSSDFAWMSAEAAEGETSELAEAYDIRDKADQMAR